MPPSRSPHIASYAPPPDRLTRAERMERRRRADEAGRVVRLDVIAPDPGEQRIINESLERSRAAFDRVLARPCPVHGTLGPCWVNPDAVCGLRVARSLERSRTALHSGRSRR